MIRYHNLVNATLILLICGWILPTHGFFSSKTKSKEQEDSLTKEEDVVAEIKLHLNGEAVPCSFGITETIWNKAALDSSDQLFHRTDVDTLEKYSTEALFTLTFHKLLSSSRSCGPSDEDGSLFRDFCDMGQEHTVIWPDHPNLVKVYDVEYNDSFLPCHFHTREGLRITSFKQFRQMLERSKTTKKSSNTCNNDDASSQNTCQDSNDQSAFHIYAVPAGRQFMFAPKFVGEIFEIEHATTPSGLPISLEVMSLSPRVFEVNNFFSNNESESIVKGVLAEERDSHRMKRSSTGASGYNINNHRTSENGFDTNGETAMALKSRSFDVLGFDEYIESFADGLQVLRYNKTTAYIPHLDWIDDYAKQQEHDYNSAKVGTNRFATILLYMSDLGENDGGETVFAHAPPLGQSSDQNILSEDEAIQQLRDSGDVKSILSEGSWEEKMVAKCRSRLSVQPRSARAVLFYSQHPDGSVDHSSFHGGCPVLNGVKWAANLWIWNGPRAGYDGEPFNEHVVKKNKEEAPNNSLQKSATFTNSGTDPAFADCDLYFQDRFWGSFSHGDPALSVNTYKGHQWNVKSKTTGEILKTWHIDTRKIQKYYV